MNRKRLISSRYACLYRCKKEISISKEETPIVMGNFSRDGGNIRVRLSLYLYRIPSSTLLFIRCHVQLRKIKD